MFKEGRLTSSIFSFAENHGVSSSTLVDFSTRITWSMLDPKDGRTVRNVSTVPLGLSLPYNHGVYLPQQYPQDSLDSIPPATRKPKTFTPILLYQRPEEPRKIACNIVKDISKSDDGKKFCGENSSSLTFITPEEMSRKRGFGDGSRGIALAKLWDMHSSYGRFVPSHTFAKSFAGSHTSSTADFSNPPGVSDTHQSGLAISDGQKSPGSRYSGSDHIPMSLISTLTRHQQQAERGSATEIRRALLLNHPVISSPITRGFPLEKAQPSELHGSCSVAYHRDTSPHQQEVITCKSTNSFNSPFSLQPKVSSWSASAPSEFSDLLARSRNGVVPSCDGRYESFLQLLYSKDYPALSDAGSGECAADCSASTIEQLPHPVKESLLHTAAAHMLQRSFGLHTSLRRGGAGDVDDRDNRKHKCPFCDVTCTNNGQLKGHLRVHTGKTATRSFRSVVLKLVIVHSRTLICRSSYSICLFV